MNDDVDVINDAMKRAIRALVMREARALPGCEDVDAAFAYLCVLKWQTNLMRASKAIEVTEHALLKAAA